MNGDDFIVRIRDACAQFAARPAIVDAAGVWTYAQLRERMDAWAAQPADGAHVIHEHPHGAEAVAALLGIFASGRCAVPLDPDQPAAVRERIRELVAQEGSPGLPGQGGFAPLSGRLLFFTSGSSGTPKGITWPERTLVRAAGNLQAMFGFVPSDRHALLSPLSVAATAAQVLAPLAVGATLCLFEARKHSSVELAGWLEREGITTLQTVPSLFRLLARETAGRKRFPKMRAVKLGGEAVTSGDAMRFAEMTSSGAVLINGLGLTEAGFNVCWRTWRVGEPLADGPFPIGRPAPELEIEIDAAPDGVGEIVVRSPDLPDGYWRDEAKTAEVYRAVPDRAGWRELRTRDAGRWDTNGELVHMGRLDQLVKIRGHRVDPAAVEAAAVEIENISAAAVVVRREGESVRLVLFVECSQNGSLTLTATWPDEIKRQLATKMPDFAIPAEVIVLSNLPRLAFGKIDRAALAARSGDTPVAEVSQQEDGRQQCRPTEALEQTLLGLFGRTLRKKRVGVSDSFFDLGGDSLAAAHLFADIAKVLRVELPLAELKQFPSVEKLAARIRGGGWNLNDNPVALLTPSPDADAVNLFVWPGAGSDVLALCSLAQELGPSAAFHAIQHRGADGRRVYDLDLDSMAERGVKLIRDIQPRGPYALCGSSFGGRIAVEVAARFRAAGESEIFLALLDTYGPDYPNPRANLSLRNRIRLAVRRMKAPGRSDEHGIGAFARAILYGLKREWARWMVQRPAPEAPPLNMSLRYLFLQEACFIATRNHALQPYEGPVHLFRVETQPPSELYEPDEALGLRAMITGPLIIADVPGRHGTHLHGANAGVLANKMSAALTGFRARAKPGAQTFSWPAGAIWDGLAEWWDQRIGDDGSEFFQSVGLDPLQRWLGNLSGLRVLDVACGNGWLSRKLARNGSRVVAIDVSKGILDAARARSTGCEIDYRLGDATRPETFAVLEPAGFDAAVCNMALQDLSEIGPMFVGVFAALRPGGWFMLSFVHPSAPSRGHIALGQSAAVLSLPGQPQPNIEARRPIEEVLALARSVGWKVVELQELPSCEQPLIALLQLRKS